MCVQLKWNWMIDVWPLGAQVRTVGGPFAQARLVDEDDHSSFSAAFFLGKGQVLRCVHGLFVALDRPPLGLLHREPQVAQEAPDVRLAEPNAVQRSMTTPTRLSVHSSVPKPWSVRLSSRTRPSAWRCSSSSRAGRPRVGMSRSASMPPSSSTAFQVYAVCRATPTACAASAAVLPASSIRPARTRRRTASSIRLVTMPRPQYLPSIGTTRERINGCHDLCKAQ